MTWGKQNSESVRILVLYSSWAVQLEEYCFLAHALVLQDAHDQLSYAFDADINFMDTAEICEIVVAIVVRKGWCPSVPVGHPHV